MAVKKFNGGFQSLSKRTESEKEISETEPATSRATFEINTDILEKMRAIAYHEKILQRDIINEAMQRFIEEYENKYGKIKPIPGIKKERLL